LSEPIDVAKVSATLSQGLLKIVAEKAVKKVGSVPVAAAA
jgi:HSP20 family molecular chaperone IbpA